MPNAAFTHIRVALLGFAVACVVTGALAAAGASAPQRETAKLPAALWAVELDARTARALGSGRLAALRRAGINTLIADRASVGGRTLAGLRGRATKARLLLLAPKRAAVRRARVRGVKLTLVRVSGPKAAVRLRRKGRVVAIARLTAASIGNKRAWRAAINAARARPGLDLAVRPAGKKPTAALNAYLALLNEATSASPPPPPPPPPPPGPPAAPPLAPASVFLAPGGSDSNPCSQAAPCRSFNRGYRVAASGATVEVAAGSYGGGTIAADASKTSAADVAFRPAAGAAVTVTGQFEMQAAHIEFRDLTVTQINFPRSADDITLRNVSNHGMWMQGPSNISVLGGEISCGFCDYHSHLQNGGGDSRPPTNILFDGVDFHDWHSVGGEHTECLQILGGDNLTIRNSVFRNCGTGNGGLGATGDLFIGFIDGGSGPVTKNVLIENNFFYRSGNVYAIQMSDLQNLDLRYNSLASPIIIFNRAGPGTGMDIVGNIMGASGCTAESNGVAINWRYNVIQGGTCGPGDKNAAAGFVDVNSNLHLAAGSAAINAGDAGSYPGRDIDGNGRPRGAAPDAGADEAG